MGTLYIVATPIGNLGDITFRAAETMKEVDLILCEDTRITSRLLARYQIKKSLLSYHQHSKLSKVEEIIALLEGGKNIALVTDAGTPGISDPGNFLLEQVNSKLNGKIQVIPIPGPSALTALVQISGIDMSKFVFLGFVPHKKGRETFFKKLIAACHPVVYYDSPHRVLKNFELLEKLAAAAGREMRLVVGRELTKIFEEVRRGTVGEVRQYYLDNPGKQKGEFAVIAYHENRTSLFGPAGSWREFVFQKNFIARGFSGQMICAKNTLITSLFMIEKIPHLS